MSEVKDQPEDEDGIKTRFLAPVVVPALKKDREPTYTNGQPIKTKVLPLDYLTGAGGDAPAECSLYDGGMCRMNAHPEQTRDTLPICKYPLHAEKCSNRPA